MRDEEHFAPSLILYKQKFGEFRLYESIFRLIDLSI